MRRWYELSKKGKTGRVAMGAAVVASGYFFYDGGSFAKDPESGFVIIDTRNSDLERASAFGKTAIDKAMSSLHGTSTTPRAGSGGLKGPFASAAVLTKALATVSSGNPVRCPENAEYKVTSSDPKFLPCLDVGGGYISSEHGIPEVILTPVISPNYDKVMDLADTLAQPKNAAQCRVVTTTLQRYGAFLLDSTEDVPSGKHAAVSVVLVPGTPNSCDALVAPSGSSQPNGGKS